jgi:ABC-type proline/glycine betaine transport system permease subunit
MSSHHAVTIALVTIAVLIGIISGLVAGILSRAGGAHWSLPFSAAV